MSDRMTREDMIATLEKVLDIEGPSMWPSGSLALERVIDALKAERPLATGFAHTEIWYLLPGENKVVWVIKPERSIDTDIAVTITERREPQVEEAAP